MALLNSSWIEIKNGHVSQGFNIVIVKKIGAMDGYTHVVHINKKKYKLKFKLNLTSIIQQQQQQ